MNRARVMFLVNGPESGAMGERSRAFAQRIAERFDFEIVYRDARSAGAAMRLWRALWRARPRIVYVLDMGAAGVIAAAGYRLLARQSKLLIDTGDAIYELVRSSGSRGVAGQWLTWLLERLGLAIADHIVVRGTNHKALLMARRICASRVTVVQDGVDLAQFAPRCSARLRDQLGLNGQLVVGLVGSSLWSHRLQMCYGWDMVEALRLLKDQPVCGVLVGDGSGIEHLRDRCRDYGIEDRMRFLGRVPYQRLPEYIAVMDICLSTQTNDIPGRVRTSGKLPLYLAAGRHVLASKVGEAERVLPAEMLIDYHGTRDAAYPQRLSERIRELAAQRGRRIPAAAAIDIAREHFDYDVLARRVADVLSRMLHE